VSPVSRAQVGDRSVCRVSLTGKFTRNRSIDLLVLASAICKALFACGQDL
jgi:hypothetical protein